MDVSENLCDADPLCAETDSLERLGPLGKARFQEVRVISIGIVTLAFRCRTKVGAGSKIKLCPSFEGCT